MLVPGSPGVHRRRTRRSGPRGLGGLRVGHVAGRRPDNLRDEGRHRTRDPLPLTVGSDQVGGCGVDSFGGDPAVCLEYLDEFVQMRGDVPL